MFLNILPCFYIIFFPGDSVEIRHPGESPGERRGHRGPAERQAGAAAVGRLPGPAAAHPRAGHAELCGHESGRGTHRLSPAEPWGERITELNWP